nr:FRAS1-related extracellular matrix protein 1 [Paramormyrops kingsleyae]
MGLAFQLSPPMIIMIAVTVLSGMADRGRDSLVTVNRGLKVKRGQTAYLEEEDLRFSAPQDRDACKVEVVLNEPITQRVGVLTPQVFDCYFHADEVKYVHNGCPILKEDKVMLRLFRFTETETYTEVFFLRVEVLEPDCSIIHLGPKSLEVPEFYSLSDKLDGNAVSFHYERRSNLECTVQVATQEAHLPAHGQLVTGEPEEVVPRGDEPQSFLPSEQQLINKARAMCKESACLNGMKLVQFIKVPCEEFLVMGLKYQHTDPPSPDIDYIAIRLDLRDTRSRSIYKSERAWIPVRIKNGIPNQPPKPAFMPTFILEVDQFILTPFSTAAVDAEDAESPRSLLVFNITKPPQEGFITHLSDHTKPIISFTWADLHDMLIAYQPPNSSHTQRRNYEVEFDVHDYFFAKSAPFMVHVSVRTADTNAPRVSWNMGLSLLEGQSRPITWEQLQIVDNDNLKLVRIITVDGLQHGRLTVRGGKGFMFTVSDIQAGVVRYHHDDSDTTKDFVVFRITDGHHQTRHKFPINILPKDDSPPFLITNMVLELAEGQIALLQGSVLQASDMDSSDDYILFNVTRPPQAGVLMKIPGPRETGYPVSHFLQRDLFHSVIYYRHLGNEIFDDSFEVVLSDFHDPPNLSEHQVIVVHITPVHDQLPKEVPGVTRHIVVKEMEVVHITKKQLHFVDPESPDSELTYTITTPPFFSSIHGRGDAGRLFLVDSIPKFTKDPSAPVLRLFTQHAVNYMKVAYMPPLQEIGIHPQPIQFVLSVTNQQGSTLIGICFNVTVLPVDNQPPQVHMNPLTVEEGGECPMDSDHLWLTDPDTAEEALRVELRAGPQHGRLHLDGFPVDPGQAFALSDLTSLKVRYHHDGSETVQDSIYLTASDGINVAEFVLQVEVALVNDEVPVLAPGLRLVLDCAEGQEVVITTEYLYATDRDTNDSRLSYMIARQPYHGVVRKNGVVVDRFIQADLISGFITYKHTGAEIGFTPRYDIITFVISDEEAENFPACTSDGQPSPLSPAARLQKALPIYDMNVTVFPVDNQAPSLITGEVFVVDEGASASITVAHLRVSDVDTPLEELEFILVSPPQFGYIENILPSPGFEKSNMGISIATFTYGDVKNGHVNYVQSRHQRTEPTADQFMVRVSDGIRQSSDTPFYIIIRPTNDEVPDFLTRNITVGEGHSKGLDPTILDAVDLDVPRDRLSFSIIEQPLHGALTANTGTAMHDFTMDELRNGMTITYAHDDSETTVDGFTIQLTDGKHQLRKRVEVTVLPINDELPHIIRNTGIEVDMGESRLISGVVLAAWDDDTPARDVLYVFESLPTEGLLQMKMGLHWVSLSAGENCSQEDLDSNLLRYLHTGSTGLQREDAFIFHLQDGANRSPVQHFRISVKTMEKGDIAVFVKPVQARRGERVVLTTEVLLALDGTDRPEELLYVVTTPPDHGHVEYIHHPGMAITSFSQMDVAANLVCYIHDNSAVSPQETLRFVVSNGQSTRGGVLDIAIDTVDRELPSILHNSGLQVPQGTTMVLSPDVLSLSDPDTPPSRLFFVLVQPPQYGQLLLRGAPFLEGNFTQQNLLDLQLAYRHGGGPAQIDRFSFTALDSSHRGFLMGGKLQTEPVFFTIQVEPLGIPAPRLVHLKVAWRAEVLKDGRYGIFVSSRELKAQGTDCHSEQLVFQVLRPPHFGYLENVTSGQFIRQRFTQRDLNRRNILYVINPASSALSDSLEFKVSDPLGNANPTHTFEFRWASLELSQAEYRVCEEEDLLLLTVLRSGNTAESSYVTIKVKEITASRGKDFTLSPSSLLQFDPGVTSRTWRLEITQDQLEEEDETFEVSLASPEGAVLGCNTSALVTIIDSGIGQCRYSQPSPGTKSSSRLTPPRHGAIQLETLPIVWTHGDMQYKSSGKRLRPVDNGKTVRPVSSHKNGSDTVFTYHGIMSLRVEDHSSPSQVGRNAKVMVASRGQQTAIPDSLERSKALTSDSKATKLKSDVPQYHSPRTCTMELTGLLHFNQSSNALWRCDGAAWRPWTPSHQAIDAQKCPQGWTYHSARCYILSKGPRLTWALAARTCKEAYNGSLVSVLSEQDMDWLWDFSGRKPFWIGLNDRENREHWEWVGGEPVTYTNWKRNPLRTKRKGNVRRCALVLRRARWHTRDCSKGKGHHYVCYTQT